MAESVTTSTTAARDEEWLVGREVPMTIRASADRVFELVADVTRIGEWSPECTGAEWLDDRRGVGARFRGRNKWGKNRWSRVCEVTRFEPGQCFEYRTVPGFGPSADSSTWGFDIAPTDDGCVLTQRVQPTIPPQRWFRPIVRRAMPHHLDMRDQMRSTLERLREAAEADH